MRVTNAFSSIRSSSWKSIARRVLPSRLELNSPEGSSSEAPLANVSLHDALVGLAGADHALVRPHRNPGVGGLSPLPLFDHFGVGLLDEGAELGESRAAPVAQLLHSCVDQLRWRLFRLCGALCHGVDVTASRCRFELVSGRPSRDTRRAWSGPEDLRRTSVDLRVVLVAGGSDLGEYRIDQAATWVRKSQIHTRDGSADGLASGGRKRLMPRPRLRLVRWSR